MGEIDTKPIESVQTAINFFGQTNNEHRKNSPTNDKEGERETDIEKVERELANIKVQLEVKEAAYKQALLKADHYHKTADELSTLLKNSDLKKNFYINESQKAASRLIELESTQEEAARLREAKAESTSQMQALEKLLSEANLRNEELSRQVSDTNETIKRLENERIQTERAHTEALAAKEVEIKRANEERGSFERAASEAASELSKLREEVEVHKKSLDQATYSISVLEAEVEQTRREKGEATRLTEHVEAELEKAREKENEAQVEIALLKFQLHKGRSRLAAAEAAETRAQGEKTALYNALQQMGLEAEETKNENRRLKEEASKYLKLADHEHKEEEEEEEEEDGILKKGEDTVISEELEKTKRELEVAKCKMGELRRRAEQAISRAEAAERARGALEEEKRKRREQRERRKAALEALRQESITRAVFEIKDNEDDDDRVDDAKTTYLQPLAKVLNMKF